MMKSMKFRDLCDAIPPNEKVKVCDMIGRSLVEGRLDEVMRDRIELLDEEVLLVRSDTTWFDDCAHLHIELDTVKKEKS